MFLGFFSYFSLCGYLWALEHEVKITENEFTSLHVKWKLVYWEGECTQMTPNKSVCFTVIS